jgi:hypothetical protein
LKLLLWFLGALPFLGAAPIRLLLGEFTDLSPWLARRLVLRAARRIPSSARPRWEEEWLGHLDRRPGRILKLLWALWLLHGAGKMGRVLGAPPASEALRSRVRAAWHKLVFRLKAPQQNAEPVPVQAEVTLGMDAELVSSGNLARLLNPLRDTHDRRAMLLAMSDSEFFEYLALQRREFEERVDSLHFLSERDED